MKQAQLTIYSASAGSGKTYTLTKEYILMMFDKIVACEALYQPQTNDIRLNNLHREILAVTFTNKATNEMKSRIVRELYLLAESKKSKYIDEIIAHINKYIQENNINLEKIDENNQHYINDWSKRILNDILNDYGLFSISTIDSFFQKIVRQFAMELNLPGGYVVDMDHEQIKSMAVDNMLYNIDDYKALKIWLTDIIEENVNEGGNWNIHSKLLKHAQILFSESFQQFLKEPKVQELINEPQKYKKIFNDYYNEVKSRCDKIYKRYCSILQKYGIEDMITNNAKMSNKLKNSISQTYNSIANGDLGKCFLTKYKQDSNAIEAFYNGLQQCYVDYIECFYDNAIAENIRKNFYLIGILGALSKQLELDNKELNRLPLSDTNRRLQQIIDGSDIPFIYEKISQRLKHYLIDEFQDTSSLQWQNFLPLVKESLDNGNDNLIVGDVKQSIYRWRNGNADILAYQIDQQFPAENISHQQLETNYRSCPHIIKWNNKFFKFALSCIDQSNKKGENKAQCLLGDGVKDSNENYKNTKGEFKTKVENYYKTIEQKANSNNNKKGLVRASFITPKEDHTYEKDLEPQLISLLDELINKRHIKPNRIAIMVRINEEGKKVAQMLTQNNYKIFSNDLLVLEAATTIQLIINIYRHIQKPKERIHIYSVYYNIASLSGQSLEWVAEQSSAYYTLLKENKTEELKQTLLGHAVNLTEHQNTLYDKTEQLVDWIMNGFGGILDTTAKQETAYMQTLLDNMHAFGAAQSTDIYAFLQWWNEHKENLNIPAPEQEDAILITTIHKAKGLEFDVAIMPYMNIRHINFGKENIQWIFPENYSLNSKLQDIPLIPISIETGVKSTALADVYYEEALHCFLDGLNTIYVAFTRPRYELYLFADKSPDKKTKGKTKLTDSYGQTLYDYLTQQLGLTDLSEDDNVETFEYADSEQTSDWTQEQQDDDNEIETIQIDNLLKSEPIGERLTIQEISTEQTKRGNLLHNIMSLIEYKDDFEEAVKKVCTGSELSQIEEIKKEIVRVITLPQTRAWFEHDHKVLNETSLLTEKGEIYRPDRIMLYPDGTIIVVDYKFTQHQSETYDRQIRNYVRLIQEAMPTYQIWQQTITTKKVLGYLLYADAKKVKQVV